MISLTWTLTWNSRTARAECLSEHGRADRIVRILDLAAADDDAEALVDLVERSLQPVLGLRDHARYGERFLELLIVDERKPAARLRRDFGLDRLELAFGKLGEVLRGLFLEQALDELALLAHLAHAVEELGLHGVRARALGEIEERVVDVLEQRRDEPVDALLRNAADELQESPSRSLPPGMPCRCDRSTTFGVSFGAVIQRHPSLSDLASETQNLVTES